MPKTVDPAIEQEPTDKVVDEPKLTQEETESDRALTDATPEQLEGMRKHFLHRSGFGPKPPEEVVTKKDEEKPKEEEKADESEKVEKDKESEAAPAKLSKAKKAKAEPATADAIKAAVKEGVTEAVRQIPVHDKPAETKPVETPVVDFSPADQATLTVLRQLEKLKPEHKGIADKTIKFWEKEEKYVAKWSEANPEEEFNKEAAEHKPFYKANEPTFEPVEYEQAKEALLEERILSKTETKHKAEIDKIRLEHQYERALPQIMQSAGQAVTEFIALAHPDFEPLMMVNGQKVLSPDIVAKFDASDKEATDVLEEGGERLRMEIGELETISRFSGAYKLDANRAFTLKSSGKKVYVHRDLQDFAENLETQLAASPKEQTSRDGRTFLTQAQYLAKIKDITTNTPNKNDQELALQDLGNRFWVLEPPAIRAALIADRAEAARNLIARMNQRVERTKASNGKPPKEEIEEETEKEPVKTERIKPPSSAVVSDKVNTGKTGNVEGGITKEQFEAKMWGR